jgi:hypothetical protein
VDRGALLGVFPGQRNFGLHYHASHDTIGH